MIKDWIQKLFTYFGYKIINLKKDKTNLDQFINKIIKNSNPIIFDVGANEGQSILLYRKYFSNPLFYCFEQDIKAYQSLESKYKSDSCINLNLLGLGDKQEVKIFNSYIETGKSSFLKLNENTDFIKYKAKSIGTEVKNYLNDNYEQKIDTIDNYSKVNNISKINLLKIDTQGYEKNIIQGANKMISENKIDIIKVEIIFSLVYEKNFNIYDIEKLLIPNGYKLFATNAYGNLLTDQNWQSDFMYISDEMFKKIKKNPLFKSFDKNY